MSRIIYFDNNATTPIAPEVVEAMQPYFTNEYFNPSSMYEPAHRVKLALDQARKSVAAVFGGINPDQILFTSCATESNNAAIYGAVKANPQRRHIITTAVEHPAVLEPCKDLARGGFDVTVLPVNRDGNLDMDAFVRALRPDTLLVTIMHANNESGVIFPVDELARLTKETNSAILFHTDATQTVGKLPIDLTTVFDNVDMLSFSGHKLHAPKGIGALYVKRSTPLRPFLIGGHQENSRRAGTENAAFIVGLARACLLAQSHLAGEQKVRELRDYLQQQIEAHIPFVEINGRKAPRLPNTLNLACHAIEGESILFQLNQHGICASSGSACTSGSLEPSHVLRAMHVPFTAIHGSVRFSLSRYNTREEVDTVVAAFQGVVQNLRHMSPYWDKTKNCPKYDMASQALPAACCGPDCKCT